MSMVSLRSLPLAVEDSTPTPPPAPEEEIAAILSSFRSLDSRRHQQQQQLAQEVTESTVRTRKEIDAADGALRDAAQQARLLRIVLPDVATPARAARSADLEPAAAALSQTLQEIKRTKEALGRIAQELVVLRGKWFAIGLVCAGAIVAVVIGLGLVLASPGFYALLWRTNLFGVGPFATFGSTNSVVFNPEGGVVTSDGGPVLNVWKWDGQVRPMAAARPVQRVALGSDGKVLIVGGSDGTIDFQNLGDGSVAGTVFKPTGLVLNGSGYAIRADRKKIAWSIKGTSNVVEQWDVVGGRRDFALAVNCCVYAMAYSPDSTALATAEPDRTVRLWDASSGKLVRQFVAHRDLIHQLAYSPDGHWLATASVDSGIGLWDVKTGNGSWIMSESPASSLSFNPDGTLLATIADGVVSVWRTSDGSRVRYWTTGGHASEIAYSPDGHNLATGGHGSMTTVWTVLIP